ncbi:MAG: tRNA lysidine(34) synthetase TilS [Paralcaligenes sp.]
MTRSIACLPEKPGALAVGVSGGADSAMLAVHCALFARAHAVPLHFFHIHHGLQTVADQWQAHVHDLAWQLGMPCHSIKVQVNVSQGGGMESAARDARYGAFSELAQQTGVKHVFLAHHRNDQAETVLLRLLRGAGPGGLAAMAPCSIREGLSYLRPWLNVDRADILMQARLFFELSGWQAVTDPSNADDRYTRAALRTRLAPELDARWPGWQKNLVRHARLSGDTQQILDEVAAADFARLEPSADHRSFSLSAWRCLTPARQALVLRFWLATLAQRMPTDARLQDLMRQMRGLHALGHDRQMLVRHDQATIRCLRGRVVLDTV